MLPFNFTTSFLMVSNIVLAPVSPPVSLSMLKLFVKLTVLSPVELIVLEGRSIFFKLGIKLLDKLD